MKIFPSLISCDLLNIETTIKKLDPHVDGYHIDIMDNHFVPNLTWGPMFANAIGHTTDKPLWIHLMVTDPLELLKKIDLKPGFIISFHIESKIKIESIINFIKENNCLASLTINPKTAVQEIIPFLDMVDQILVMSVEPGFSGQQFLMPVLDTIDLLCSYRTHHNLSFSIAMDGGINQHNILLLKEKNVNAIAVASAIFNHTDPIQAIKQLKKYIE